MKSLTGFLLGCAFLLSACEQFWTRDNPIDPGSKNYLGYETVVSPDALVAVSPANGSTLTGTTLTVTKIIGAKAYEIVIATSVSALDSGPLFAKADYPTNVLDISAAVILDKTGYWWKGRAVVGEKTGAWSPVATFSTSFSPAATPTFNPEAGAYSSSQDVTISSASAKATLYYTIDGSDPANSPTRLSGTSPLGPVTAAPSTTIRAIATAPWHGQSTEGSATYSQLLLTLLRVAGGSFSNGTGTVTLGAFLMSEYEVTQAQYQAVTGVYPSFFTGDATCPVEQVSWYDVVEFCNTLSKREGLRPVYTISGRSPATGYPITVANVTADFTANGYRLPSEAQWEYAARGGSSTLTYAGSDGIDGVAWYVANSGAVTHAVGGKNANQLGLHDLSGNVEEWCWDWSDAYPSGAQTNPTGSAIGTLKIVRGGSLASATSDCTVKVRHSKAPEYLDKGVGFRVVRPVTLTPTFSPAGAAFTSDQSVAIACATAGSIIYYTMDGTVPTTSSSLYSGALSVAGQGTNTTIKAIATAPEYAVSDPGSATYSITYDAAATPSFNPAGGTKTSDQSVTISSATSGANFYDTLDGSTPTTSSTLYAGAISIAGNGTTKTIEAIATAPGFASSAVGSASYTITYPTASTPTFSISAGTYSTDQSVTISSTTTGANFYYTLDGSTPTTSSTLYAGAISIAGNGTTRTIKVIAIASGFAASVAAGASYTIAYPSASTPTFSVVGGTYSTDQSVTISSATTGGTTIYDTTDGTTPTISSMLYTGAISVPANVSKTLNAIAIATSPAYVPSAVATVAYNCLLAMLPVASGSFNNGISIVTLSPFTMSRYEITQAQYLSVTGNNPSYGAAGGSNPVQKVTWYDTVEFCNKLSTMEGLANVYLISARTPATGYPITSATVNADFSKNGYRLPTEAEWEFAARGGTRTQGYTYAGSNSLGDVAYIPPSYYSSDMVPKTVGWKAANEIGLFDMSGNVSEWCWDWSGTYPIGAQTDPVGPDLGNNRVVRGGSYYDCYYYIGRCAVSDRESASPNASYSSNGFRVVRRPPF